jgi:hypothetical protein
LLGPISTCYWYWGKPSVSDMFSSYQQGFVLNSTQETVQYGSIGAAADAPPLNLLPPL